MTGDLIIWFENIKRTKTGKTPDYEGFYNKNTAQGHAALVLYFYLNIFWYKSQSE